MSATEGFSRTEMMIVAAARELAGQRVCFVGVGLPNIAVNLAKRTVSPDLQLVYEAGVFGAEPARLPLSIGAQMVASGELLARGVKPPELVFPSEPFFRELAKRGITVEETIQQEGMLT